MLGQNKEISVCLDIYPLTHHFQALKRLLQIAEHKQVTWWQDPIKILQTEERTSKKITVYPATGIDELSTCSKEVYSQSCSPSKARENLSDENFSFTPKCRLGSAETFRKFMANCLVWRPPPLKTFRKKVEAFHFALKQLFILKCTSILFKKN